MAKLKVKAFAAGYFTGAKKFQGEVQTDRSGAPLIQRKLTVVDLESDQADTYKINVPEELEKIVQELLKQNVDVLADVGHYNGHPFYRLVQIVPAKAA